VMAETEYLFDASNPLSSGNDESDHMTFFSNIPRQDVEGLNQASHYGMYLRGNKARGRGVDRT